MKPVTDDYLDECTHYRAPPGEGEFDVDGFLRVLYGTATTAPVSVEVMSDELDLLPVQTTADRLAAATRRALAAASLGPAGAEGSRPTTRRG